MCSSDFEDEIRLVSGLFAKMGSAGHVLGAVFACLFSQAVPPLLPLA